jgi:hypothetical protein
MRFCQSSLAVVLLVLLIGPTTWAEGRAVADRSDTAGATATLKPDSARTISASPDSARYRITIDWTDTPELKQWVKEKLRPAVDTWYPKIIEELPSENYTPPTRVTIVITNDYHGVAVTSGTHVRCSAEWFKKNSSGEAAGAVIHELVHVVQQYGHAPAGKPNPGWLVEGIADYIRWFQYEPVPKGTRPRNPDKAKYTDSYRTTAGFLNYVVDRHDKQLVVKLNAAMRQGKYSAALWKKYTGKTVDELWDEYVASLKQPHAGSSPASRAVDT